MVDEKLVMALVPIIVLDSEHFFVSLPKQLLKIIYAGAASSVR